MGYRLGKQERDLTQLLRRVTADELGAALALAPEQAGAVHDARKRVKKVRALLRLVQPGFAPAQACSRRLGDAASGLSAVRDAEVMIAVHDRLAPELAEGAVRALLVARLEAARADPQQETHAATFRAVLAQVLAEAPHWRVRGNDVAVLTEGLARTRRRGLKAMAAAEDDRDGEPMHDWRKRVKDLWYQARLLSPVWPSVMHVIGKEAGELGEMLGDHHDLLVFSALLDGLPGDPALAAPSNDLRARAARARGQIEAGAFPMGRVLLSGKSGSVAALWAEWWRLWRDR